MRQGRPKKHQDYDLEDSAAPDSEAVEEWKRHFVALSTVKPEPPEWVIRNLLVPGLNLMVGAPKTFKSTLVMHMIAAMLERIPVSNGKDGKRAAVRRGPVVYFAAEQNARRIKHAYEQRVLRRKMKKGSVSWDFAMPKNAWRWQIDVVDEPYNFVRFIKTWKPMIVVIDPLVYFHQLDENDPQLVRPLVPLREAVLAYGGALVVVHHARKKGNDDKSGMMDFDRVRGTGALWGMSDAGLLLSRMASGAVNVNCVFKDHPDHVFTWRPQ